MTGGTSARVEHCLSVSEIGLARRTQPFELEDAITEKTAAVAHLISPFTSPPGVLTPAQVVAIAHRRGVPVIVDAASMLPPRENLTKFLRLGADLVSFSGGKGIRGPQSTGILAGRRDLVRAVSLNASPNQALGRAAKTSKDAHGPRTRLDCCTKKRLPRSGVEHSYAESAQRVTTCRGIRFRAELERLHGLHITIPACALTRSAPS